MFRFYTAVSLVAMLSACGSGTQPFDFGGTTTDETGTTDSSGTTGTTTEEEAENTGTLEVGTPLPSG